jgi:2-polyprenyl-3-methyl-5-hydroxy-6-metoxy-1,4-benzoquinol methylase
MTRTTAQTPCPACGRLEADVVSTRDGKTGEALLVVACAGCGLGRIDPFPTPEGLAQWYKTRYRQDYKASVRPKLTHVLRAARLAQERWAWASRQPGRGAPRRTLDVGASGGEFVYLMQTLGADAHGVEPHEGYSTYARSDLGLQVVSGTLQEHLPTLPPQSYDLVSMFHVLEHLLDPVQALRDLAGLLAPGGHLLIEVPDASRLSSPNNMFFRAHTLYFTSHALTAVAQAAGLRVVAHNFDAQANLLVLLQPDAALGQPVWQPDHSLVQGQAQRRWDRYLWSRLGSGYLWRRWLSRRNEKQTAAQHTHARDLLNAVYRG